MAITTDLNHYVTQLSPIDVTLVMGKRDDEQVGRVLQGLYRGLFGGLAWLTHTRADILVFAGRYQRHSQQETVADVLGLNRILK